MGNHTKVIQLLRQKLYLSPILSNFFLESRQSQYGHIFCRTELTKQNLSLLPSSEFLSLLLKNLLGNWIILLFFFFFPISIPFSFFVRTPMVYSNNICIENINSCNV